jgi:hypothetical protein
MKNCIDADFHRSKNTLKSFQHQELSLIPRPPA